MQPSIAPGPVWWGASPEPLDYRLDEADRLAFQLWAHDQRGATVRVVRTYRQVLAWSTALLFFVLTLAVGTAGLRPELRRWVLLASALIAAATWLMGWALGPSIARDEIRRRLRRAIRRRRDGRSAPSRMWAEPSGITVEEHGVRSHREWAILAEPATTAEHHFLIIRTHPRAGSTMSLILPRRLGPAADALADVVRRLAAAPSPTRPGPGAPPVWGPPPPGAVDFVLTVEEHERRLAWSRERGGLDRAVRERRRRELTPSLVLLPVLVILWTPALLGYRWTSLIPALVVTLPAVAGVAWGWATAPARQFRKAVAATALLCREDAVGIHGPVRVWLDDTGLVIKHLHQQDHVAWHRIADLTETPDLVLVKAAGLDLAIPRRAHPPRVAQLAAGLRAATGWQAPDEQGTRRATVPPD